MQPLQEVHCSNSCEQTAAWSDKPLEMRAWSRTTRTLFWLMHEFIVSHSKPDPRKSCNAFLFPHTIWIAFLSWHYQRTEISNVHRNWPVFVRCLKVLWRPPTSSWSCVVWYSSWLRVSWGSPNKLRGRADWDTSVKTAALGFVSLQNKQMENRDGRALAKTA